MPSLRGPALLCLKNSLPDAPMTIDHEFILLLSCVGGILVLASIAGWLLSRRSMSPSRAAVVSNLNSRVRSWWVMAAVFCLTLFGGHTWTTVLFGTISFLALREFITLNETRRSDHAVLFWVFFVITPLHYFLTGIRWYGFFSVFIPVYAFVFIPFRKVLTGETEGFLGSMARIQWGLLVCVYFVSHMPMILALPLRGYEGENGKLLFFFVLTVQLSDVLQYVWGRTLGKHRVAPHVSPNKTWEGALGGILTTVALSTALWWATPFTPVQAACMALLICVAGFLGGLVMSAIKRDLGAKDWGSSIAGHGGFMDRIDSLCFAAPLFFHICGFYFGTGIDPMPPEWIGKLLGK
jgi:phosphatidate cytidylyltransferase